MEDPTVTITIRETTARSIVEAMERRAISASAASGPRTRPAATRLDRVARAAWAHREYREVVDALAEALGIEDES